MRRTEIDVISLGDEQWMAYLKMRVDQDGEFLLPALERAILETSKRVQPGDENVETMTANTGAMANVLMNLASSHIARMLRSFPPEEQMPLIMQFVGQLSTSLLEMYQAQGKALS
jgi:hypothetical protein